MGTEGSDEALVRRWSDGINERDIEALLPLAHEDIEVYPLQFGVSGVYTGRDGLARWMDELRKNDLGHTVTPQSVRVLPDGRVVLFGTVIADGAELSPYALVATIKDGKIAVMRSYLNDERTLELLGLLD